MSKIRSIVAAQSSVGEPELRVVERSEAALTGGSPTLVPDVVPVVPDSEVTRCFTTAYKLDILRRADACGGHGDGCGRRGSTPRTWARGVSNARPCRRRVGGSRRLSIRSLKKLEQENRRLTLRRAEALLAFQKKVSELLQIPLKPFVSDGDD